MKGIMYVKMIVLTGEIFTGSQCISEREFLCFDNNIQNISKPCKMYEENNRLNENIAVTIK